MHFNSKRKDMTSSRYDVAENLQWMKGRAKAGAFGRGQCRHDSKQCEYRGEGRGANQIKKQRE